MPAKAKPSAAKAKVVKPTKTNVVKTQESSTQTVDFVLIHGIQGIWPRSTF